MAFRCGIGIDGGRRQQQELTKRRNTEMIAVRRLNAVAQRVGARLDHATPDVAEVLVNPDGADERAFRHIAPRPPHLHRKRLHPPEAQRRGTNRRAHAAGRQRRRNGSGDLRWNRISMLDAEKIGRLKDEKRNEG